MFLPTYTGSDAWSQGSRRYCGTGAIGRASGHPTAGNPGFRGLLCVIEACLGLPAPSAIPSAIPSARMGSIPCPVANLRRIQAVVSCLTPGDAGTAPSRTRRAACKSLHHAAQQGKQGGLDNAKGPGLSRGTSLACVPERAGRRVHYAWKMIGSFWPLRIESNARCAPGRITTTRSKGGLVRLLHATHVDAGKFPGSGTRRLRAGCRQRRLNGPDVVARPVSCRLLVAPSRAGRVPARLSTRTGSCLVRRPP